MSENIGEWTLLSFNTTLRQMIEMSVTNISQQKNDRNIAMKKNSYACFHSSPHA